jgi:DNA-binding XRE family transcriptional regulator
MGEFRITGDVPVFYLDLTRRLFPNLMEEAKEEEATNIRDWDWFQKKAAAVTPGDSLRILRTMREMKQTELAKLAGVESRQISDMEKGRASIGKKMAMKLGKILDMDYRLLL